VRGLTIGDLVRVKRTDGSITPAVICACYPDWVDLIVGPSPRAEGKTFADCVQWVQENAHLLAVSVLNSPWPMHGKRCIPKDELLPFMDGAIHWFPATSNGNTACGIPVTKDVLVTTSQTKPFLTCGLCKGIFNT